MKCACHGGPHTVICGRCIALERAPKRTYEGMTKDMAKEGLRLHRERVPLPVEYIEECKRVLNK